MKRKIQSAVFSSLVGLTAALFINTGLAGPNGKMTGLALHQETGRSIFLGALYSDDPTSGLADYHQGEGAWLLEHRVIARRTSVRSVLGKILLQGELATGQSPQAAVISFADDIMSGIKGSLYAGDALEIERRESSVAASLNGFEIATSSEVDVFSFFLMAWTGDRGPSTHFRTAILNRDIDSGLLELYSNNSTSQERIAAVSAWAAPVEEAPEPDEPAPIAEPAAAVAIAATAAPAAAAPAAERAPGLADAGAKGPTLATTTEMDPAPVEETPEPVPAPAKPEPEALQVAMVEVPDALTASDVDAIDAREYSQRLGDFNTALIKRVYSEIRYPRAAVRRSLQGTLELDVTLNQEGELVTISVANSSGYDMLDNAAMKAAKKALASGGVKTIDPVAVAEYGAEGDELVIPVPVSFILTE